MGDNIFQHLTRDGTVNVGGRDAFHSQHPTKTVNLSVMNYDETKVSLIDSELIGGKQKVVARSL